MLDHLSIQFADVKACALFYDSVLAPLGGERVMDFGDVTGFGIAPQPEVWIGPRSTGERLRESHIAFSTPDRAAVGALPPRGSRCRIAVRRQTPRRGGRNRWAWGLVAPGEPHFGLPTLSARANFSRDGEPDARLLPLTAAPAKFDV